MNSPPIPDRLPPWHLLVLVGVIFAHSLSLSAVYRLCLYANIIIVIYCWRKIGASSDIFSREILLKIGLAPLVIAILHLASTHSLELTKEMRSMIVCAFFSLGIMLFISLNKKPKTWLILIVVLFIAAYTFIQTVVLFMPGMKYGTTKNPHYLAQYCLLLLPVAAYLFSITNNWIRYLLVICIVILVAIIIGTASRPAWIALLLICGFFVLHQRGKRMAFSFAIILAVLTTLYFTNVGNFGDKLHDLYANVQHEERVYIWRDALSMQQQSTPSQWLIGHGLGSFKEDFVPYSMYHDQGIDFTGPHNFFIELLYLSGLFGLLAIFALVVGLYFGLVKHYIRQDRSPYALMLIAILTANLAFVSITIPFFTSYNLVILGLIGGLALSLNPANGHRTGAP